MAIEMKVPAVGESITEVTVATWNKKEGDHVKLDEVLCELESDKATFELPAEAEGVLHIVAKEGDVLPSWWRCRKGGRIEVGVGTAPEIARAEGWVNYRISLVGEPHPLALEGQPALVLVAKDARGMTRHLAGHNQSLGFAVNTVACTTTAGAWGSRY